MPTDATTELAKLADRLMESALQRGAQIAEANASAGWELSARVRLGEPELVEEAGTRSVALRVMRDQRVATTSTSDLTESGIERCVADALELLDLAEPDPCAGPAGAEEIAQAPFPELDLYDEAVFGITADDAVARATEAERAALAHDARLNLSEGATFSRRSGSTALAFSNGFRGAYRATYAYLGVSPVLEDEGGKRRRGHYWTGARHLSDLEAPEAVGVEAARRTLAKLGARKVSTCEAPVIYDPDVSRSLLGMLAQCVVGSAIWRKSSYLLDRVGSQVASPLVTIVDDPLRARAPGARPFDGEGLPSRKNIVVKGGELRTYLLDCYSARKLEAKSTASASRSGGSVGPQTSTFYLEPGARSLKEIVAATERGLYVTDMMGFGFNAVTGDYSRGASGYWIEGGKFAHPVSEVTVSSNLDTMLKSIDAIASELDFKTATCAPGLRIASMTIAGS